jgi:hypothetical protein
MHNNLQCKSGSAYFMSSMLIPSSPVAFLFFVSFNESWSTLVVIQSIPCCVSDSKFERNASSSFWIHNSLLCSIHLFSFIIYILNASSSDLFRCFVTLCANICLPCKSSFLLMILSHDCWWDSLIIVFAWLRFSLYLSLDSSVFCYSHCL